MYNYTKYMAKPELSIIIVSYNTKKITIDCINSIIKSTKNSPLNYEIIVIDNNSKDGTVQSIDKLCNNYSNIRIIVNNDNIGFAKANNLAVKQARGDCLLFLNSDIIVLNDAVNKLFKFYKQNENTIHFLGGKLFNKNMSSQPSAGPFYTLPIIFVSLFLKGDYWGLTRYSPDRLKKVDWISGACILTKKEYYEKLHGFDEGIFLYMEEIDLLYRARLKNYNTFFYPDAKFIHIGFASSGNKSSPIINVYRGFLYFYKKHFSTQSLFFLKILLKLKARVAILIGKLTKSHYLLETYEKALKLVEMA